MEAGVAYGVCVGSDEKLERYVLPRTMLSVVYTRRHQTSIAKAYNGMLDDARADGFQVLILQHDDLEITDPDGEEKIVAALQGAHIGLVGVAGGGDGNGLSWWTHEPIGHQKTDTMDIDFGRCSGVATLLEGSLLAFGPWAIAHLRFDERYPGFHGYDCDIARQCREKLMFNAVVDVDTWHHNPMGFKSEASHQEWLACDVIFREKWGVTGK